MNDAPSEFNQAQILYFKHDDDHARNQVIARTTFSLGGGLMAWEPTREPVTWVLRETLVVNDQVRCPAWLELRTELDRAALTKGMSKDLLGLLSSHTVPKINLLFFRTLTLRVSTIHMRQTLVYVCVRS